MGSNLTQQEIDGIRKTLQEAKSYSGLGPNDPSVIALEQIMNAKIAALEAATTSAAPSQEAPPVIASLDAAQSLTQSPAGPKLAK